MQKLMFSLFIFLFYTQIFAQFSGGSGTALDPYQVATKADLNNVRNHLSSHFIQTSNIMFDDADFQIGGTYYNAGAQWEPISAFAGTYDGNNHVIDGIKVNRPSTNSIGVFGHVSGATTLIENLGVSNVNIVGQNYVGGLIGSTIDVGVIIQNCFSTGSINGNGFVGGLVGDLRGGPIVRYSYSTANVAGVTYTGGLVGGNTENGANLPSISNCYSTGDVTIKSGTDHRNGAFVGENYGGSVINCYSIGNVYYTPSGFPTNRGFIGNYLSGTISNNFFDEELSNQTTGTGATATTTANMKTQTTFTNAGWDFGTDETDWVMSSNISFFGYPTLRWTGGYAVDPTGSPKEIATLPNLVWIAENSSRWADNYIQIANLKTWTTPSWDDEKGWTPIGNYTTRFTGDYNGQNYTISNLFINRSSGSPIGFIGATTGSEIQNIGLINLNIIGDSPVGGLVGTLSGASSINNSYISGSITGNNFVGGLVGVNTGASSISNSYSSGSFTGNYSVGGLVGVNQLSSSISNSYISGSITGIDFVGGLVGVNTGAASISNSYSKGNATGSSTVGGLVGINQSSSSINNSYSTGNASGSSYVGGLVGVTQSSSSISNCYSTGNVTRSSGSFTTFGGLIGQNNESSVQNCFSTGKVFSSEGIIWSEGGVNDKGFLGIDNGGTFLNNFFDSEASEQTLGFGATAKTTADMKTQSTFSSWDFSTIWDIQGSSNCSYPYLRDITYDTPWTSPEVNPIPGLASSEVWVDASYNSGTTGWGITHFNNLTTALSIACESGIVNISNYTHTGNVDMTGRTFIIGSSDFNLTGNLSGGLIQASGTGSLRMKDLAANTTKTFPITDGTHNYTITITTADNTNPDISVNIVANNPSGSINSDFWEIMGPNNLDATVTLRIDKAAIAPKTLNSTSQLRYWKTDDSRYVPINGNNFTISDEGDYYIITLTHVNEFLGVK